MHKHRAYRKTNYRAYQGGVAQEPETHENRRAHGNIAYTEHCSCGAIREVVANAGAREVSPWISPTQDAG